MHKEIQNMGYVRVDRGGGREWFSFDNDEHASFVFAKAYHSLLHHDDETDEEDIIDTFQRKKTVKINAFGRMTQALIDRAKQQELSRFDGFVYMPHCHFPRVGVMKCTSEEYINETLRGNLDFQTTSKFKELVIWMDSKDSVEFPIHTNLCDDLLAFRNGVLDTNTLKFTLWDDVPGKNIITYWFIDEDYTSELYTKKTPYFTSLIKTQLFNRYVSLSDDESKETLNEKYKFEIIHGLIGRTLFPLQKHDYWKVGICVVGDMDNGKTTLLDIISELLPRGSVCMIGNHKLGKYTLSTMLGKRLILCPNVQSSLKKAVDDTDFSKMMLGKKIHVMKRGVDKTEYIRWNVPMLCAAYDAIAFTDTQKQQWTDRIIPIHFNTEIPSEAKTSLLKKICLRDERGAIVIQLIKAYHNLVHKVGCDSDIHDFIIDDIMEPRTTRIKKTPPCEQYLKYCCDEEYKPLSNAMGVPVDPNQEHRIQSSKLMKSICDYMKSHNIPGERQFNCKTQLKEMKSLGITPSHTRNGSVYTIPPLTSLRDLLSKKNTKAKMIEDDVCAFIKTNHLKRSTYVDEDDMPQRKRSKHE